MSENRDTQHNTEIEAALATLRPRSSRLDRDQMMFLAGQASQDAASVQRRRLLAVAWPCATVAASLLALFFAALHVSGPPQQQDGERTVDHNKTTPPVIAAATATEGDDQTGAYWAVRAQLLASESSDAWLQASVASPTSTPPKKPLRVGSRMLLDQLLEPNQISKEPS